MEYINLIGFENINKNNNIKFFDKKNKIRINKYLLLIYGLFYLSIIFYFLGLRGCKSALTKCQAFTDIEMYIKRGFETAFSSILFSFSIFFIIYFKKKYIHILLFIVIYIIIFINTQGNDFIRHGTYNCILFLSLILIWLIYMSGIYFIILRFIGNKKNKLFAILILLLLISPFIFYITRTKCIKWNYGLGNIEIEYDTNFDSCKITNPFICTIGIFGNLFDLSSYIRKTCKGYNNKKKIFDKYLNYTQKKF